MNLEIMKELMIPLSIFFTVGLFLLIFFLLNDKFKWLTDDVLENKKEGEENE